jgi:tellurium resistance protein TerD
VDLTKTNPGLKKVLVGLGWDTNKYDGGHAFDLDSQIFMVGNDNKSEGCIFYNNLKDNTGAIQHLGDNLTGEGEGDDEQIKIDLSIVPVEIQKLVFTVTIHEADVRQQNFGQVSNAFIRIVNEELTQELIRYDLSEDFSIETVVIIGELYRHDNEWKFNAIGSGSQGDLKTLFSNFGVK